MKGKTLDIVIDNGSTDNLISSKAVAALKLVMDKHPPPYQSGWIKFREAAMVVNTCVVPLSIGKSYSDMAICDVADMDATHIILGRALAV